MNKHGAPTDKETRSLGAPGIVTRANLEPYLSDAARKQQFVTPLFDLIAPQYDRFTRVFSFGMDRRWKRELLAWVARDHEARRLDVLDVACGTGDLALAMASALPASRVTGIDVSTRMLELARARLRADSDGRLTFSLGDLAHVDAPAASFDVITGGYAVRNAPDPRQAVTELARVLRPGGRLYILDFFLPRQRAWRALFLGYLRAAGVVVGWWWHRTPAAYEYIAASIEHFVALEAFVAWLSAAGFAVERTSRKLGGGVALIAAVRR